MNSRLIACALVPFVVVAYGQESEKPPATTKVMKSAAPTSQPTPLYDRYTSSTAGTKPAASEAHARQRWEYTRLAMVQVQKRGDGDFDAGMNRLGQEGWELVTVQWGDPRQGIS